MGSQKHRCWWDGCYKATYWTWEGPAVYACHIHSCGVFFLVQVRNISTLIMHYLKFLNVARLSHCVHFMQLICTEHLAKVCVYISVACSEHSDRIVLPSGLHPPLHSTGTSMVHDHYWYKTCN